MNRIRVLIFVCLSVCYSLVYLILNSFIYGTVCLQMMLRTQCLLVKQRESETLDSSPLLIGLDCEAEDESIEEDVISGANVSLIFTLTKLMNKLHVAVGS